MTTEFPLHRRARLHLRKSDPVMRDLVARVGLCTLVPGGDPFPVLVRSVVGQLISTAAAATVYARLEAAANGVTPANLTGLGEEAVRKCGLSGTKAGAILDLARRAADGTLPLAGLAEMEDDAIATSLTAVRGIGLWTAEMFLIFCVGRLDVLPVGDFGLRAGVRDLYGLGDLPAPKQLREMATAWRPYRSIATWYVWRSRGLVPQSE